MIDLNEIRKEAMSKTLKRLLIGTGVIGGVGLLAGASAAPNGAFLEDGMLPMFKDVPEPLMDQYIDELRNPTKPYDRYAPRDV